MDGSGQLPSGEQVNNEADLRKLLASRKTQLTRNLTHKLLLHATGRKPSYRDHHIINQIVEQSLAGGQWTHREWRMLRYLKVDTQIIENTTPVEDLRELDGIIH